MLEKKPPELCGDCHADFMKRLRAGQMHPPVAMGMCMTCHDPHGSDRPAMTRRSGAELCTVCHSPRTEKLVAKHPGMDLATANCVSCHDPHVGEKGTRGMLRANQHAPFAKGECTSCHTGRGTANLKAKGATLCFTCHASAQPEFARKFHHAPVDSPRECLSCHGPHAAAAKPMLSIGGDELCLSCHGRKLFQGKLRHAALDQGCVACHDPHSSDSRKMLKQPEARLCAQCHADLSKHFHKTTSDKPDPRTGEGLTCTGCHSPHTADIKGLLRQDPRRELCIQCHDPNEFPDVK
jgi:predicted CXXCH cytochrome family protein